MKKNILAVIILAATLVNLTLSGVMLFVYLPNAQKMNMLIEKVCQNIDLELESPLPPAPEIIVSVKDLDVRTIGSEMTVMLSKSSNGANYYASITASVALNTKAEDYETIAPLIDSQSERIKEVVQNEIGRLTGDNFQEDKEVVKETILRILQQEFQTECIYRIDFGRYVMVK